VVPDDRVDGLVVNFREHDALVPEFVQVMSHFVRQMDKLPLGQCVTLSGAMLHRILQALDGLCIEQWRTAVGYLDCSGLLESVFLAGAQQTLHNTSTHIYTR
jgi:hypothetical protein